MFLLGSVVRQFNHAFRGSIRYIHARFLTGWHSYTFFENKPSKIIWVLLLLNLSVHMYLWWNPVLHVPMGLYIEQTEEKAGWYGESFWPEKFVWRWVKCLRYSRGVQYKIPTEIQSGWWGMKDKDWQKHCHFINLTADLYLWGNLFSLKNRSGMTGYGA